MIEIVDIERVYPTYLKIPEFGSHLSLDEIKGRIANKDLCLAYFFQGEIIGFKLGYEKSREEFYSWIGAVLPAHRRKGIAKALLAYQENWAAAQGYELMSVKSMNIYPAMLTMLLSNNYKISDLTKGATIEEHKIHFIKKLNLGINK